MKNELHQNLILCGYKSSGKTFFGALLAKELYRLFIDTDQLIEELYKKEYHEEGNCRQIAIKMGEEGFRRLEKKVIHRLKGVTDAIIALGGGAVLDPDNCLKLGKLIYLEADKETLRERIFSGEIPSYLDANDLEGSFDRMYEERRPIYEKVCTFKIQLQGKTNRQVLDELINVHQF